MILGDLIAWREIKIEQRRSRPSFVVISDEVLYKGKESPSVVSRAVLGDSNGVYH